MSRLWYVLVCVLVLGFGAANAQDQSKVPFEGEGGFLLPKRLALVIGVNNYRASELTPLTGPSGDADKVSQFLTGIGFAHVEKLPKPPSQPGQQPSQFVNRNDILDQLNDLAQRSRDARKPRDRGAIVVVYFSGHGVSVDGKNYLVPSDFKADAVGDVKDRAISVEEVALKLAGQDQSDEKKQGHASLVVIVTDACRIEFPFFKGGGRVKSTFRDLETPPAPMVDGDGHVALIYATVSGAAAFDGDEGSVFTNEFLETMKAVYDEIKTSPGRQLSLHDLVKRAKSRMVTGAGSKKKQMPKFDDQWAQTYYPFPTYLDYAAEKQLYEKVQELAPKDGDPRTTEALRRMSCLFENVLSETSWYSYFSGEMLKVIQAARPFGGSGHCPTGTGRLRRDEVGKWQTPSLEQRAEGQRGEAPLPRVRLASSDGRFQLAQASRDTKGKSADTGDDPLARLTFGDLRKLLQTSSADTPLPRLPDSVLLNNAVITREASRLRSAPGSWNAEVGSVPANEYYEVIGTSPGRTWLQIRHPGGIGFIGGDVVEPAIVPISKTVTFAPGDLDLSADNKTAVATAFAMLGGVAVVDVTIEYPETSGKVGLLRGLALQEFFGSISVGQEQERRYQPIFRFRRSLSAALEPNQVRITVLALPLRQEVRAAIANLASPKSVSVNSEAPGGTICSKMLNETRCSAGVESMKVGSTRKVDEAFKDLEGIKDLKVGAEIPKGAIKNIQELKIFRLQ